MLETMNRPEIRAGVLVDLEPCQLDENARELVERWQLAYEWPMRVHQRLPQHVSLKKRDNGKEIVNESDLVHFGSTADSSLNIGFVKLHE